MNQLFRQAAVDAQAQAHWGRPAADLPRAWSFITGAILILAIGIVFFTVFTDVSRKESVRGRLVSTVREARVFAPDVGVVREVAVSEGQYVAQGEVLAVVATDRPNLAGQDTNDAVIAALQEEVSTLGDQARRLDEEFALRERDLKAALSLTEAQADVDQVRLEALSHRIVLAQERLDAARTLAADGWTPQDEVRRREELVVQLEQELAETKIAQAGRAAEVERGVVALEQLPLDRENRRSELAAARARLEQRLADAGYSEGFSLRAPVAGRVAAVQASPGDRVAPDQPLVIVAPVGGRLEAEVYIPSRAIGFVAEGVPVRLMFDAFPYQHFGYADGDIRSVTRTVIIPNHEDPTLNLQEPSYRAYVSLGSQEIEAYGEAYPLQPGMALQADIILEERSFLAWVMEPVASMRGGL